jgi:hypothetical protein
VARLGARVRPGHFSQTYDRPEPVDRTLLDVLVGGDVDREGMTRADAMRRLARYELAGPTDNLDLASAEASERALDAFEGTVVAVTHDRWFTRGFDRFVVFTGDGNVREALEPLWE